MALFLHRKEPQLSPEQWRAAWQSLVPASCRSVPISVDGTAVTAFIYTAPFAVMLQDRLLMEPSFFDVCEHFQRAGCRVVWLMRCDRDVAQGFLRRGRRLDGGQRQQWIWKRPTTNFGRWISDNHGATILLQTRPLPEGPLSECRHRILQRVVWAESDRDERMVPDRTVFYTVDRPGTPEELLRWLKGAPIGSLR